MKPAIPIAGAFIVGLAGGTFAAKGPPAPIEASVAKKGAASADTTHAKADTTAATVPVPVPPDSAAAQSGSQGLVVEGSGSAATPPAAAKPGDDAQQLANSFAKLSASEILPIATHMSDEDLLPVLRKLDVGKSAAVLALMPKSRSSGLSKKLLVPATMASKP